MDLIPELHRRGRLVFHYRGDVFPEPIQFSNAPAFVDGPVFVLVIRQVPRLEVLTVGRYYGNVEAWVVMPYNDDERMVADLADLNDDPDFGRIMERLRPWIRAAHDDLPPAPPATP